MAVSTSTANELTAEQVQKILVQPLEDKSLFLAAGPRIFDTNGSQVRIPKLGGPTTPAWHGENEQITEQDPSFDEIVLLPSTMKSVKVLTRYSNEMARQSVVALDAALRDRLVTDVAATIDAQLFSATGDGITQPKGILAWDDTQRIDAAGADLDLDALVDAWGTALAANVDTTRLRWFMRPEAFTALRKIKQGSGSNQYVLTPDATADGVFRLFGSQVVITNRLPRNEEEQQSVVLADFTQVAVARDQAPTVKILDQTFGDYDQQAIRVTARYDAAPLNPEAVVIIEGLA